MSTTASAPVPAPETRRPRRQKVSAASRVAVDHLDRRPQDLGGRAQEVLGVGRAAQRLGADRGDAGLVLVGEGGVVTQHRQGAGDAVGAQAAVPPDAPAEPGDLGALRQDLMAGAVRATSSSVVLVPMSMVARVLTARPLYRGAAQARRRAYRPNQAPTATAAAAVERDAPRGSSPPRGACCAAGPAR